MSFTFNLKMLQAFFIPALQENPTLLLQRAFLQLDGAPPHSTHNIKVF